MSVCCCIAKETKLSVFCVGVLNKVLDFCDEYVPSITSNDVQSNTTSLTNIFIDLGLHVSIH